MFFYSPENVKIKTCQGCISCFLSGKCIEDKEDGFYEVKEKMLLSDIIIFGSPVYAASVSGDMKVFIDRVSYMLHLLALRGKIGIPFLTASTNSLYESNLYLSKIMNYLGLTVPFSVMGMTDFPKQVEDDSLKEKIEKEFVPQICGLLDGQIPYSSSPLQENYFKSMKNTYLFQENLTTEKMYWIKNGLLEKNSFQEVLDGMK